MGQAGDVGQGAGSVDDHNGPPSRPALRIELPIGPAFVDEAPQPGYQDRPSVSGARHSSPQVRKPACPGPRWCGVVGQKQSEVEIGGRLQRRELTDRPSRSAERDASWACDTQCTAPQVQRDWDEMQHAGGVDLRTAARAEVGGQIGDAETNIEHVGIASAALPQSAVGNRRRAQYRRSVWMRASTMGGLDGEQLSLPCGRLRGPVMKPDCGAPAIMPPVQPVARGGADHHHRREHREREELDVVHCERQDAACDSW
jgi:hypothetical protein